jgi:hypothetical protein
LKQNKKAKICFVIYIAGFFFKKNLCYEVFAKQKILKLSSNHYLHRQLCIRGGAHRQLCIRGGARWPLN